MYSSASAIVLFIFQLPAISGVRVTLRPIRLGLTPISASTPGIGRPSIISSVAPPPVERWVTPSSRPNLTSAAAESPPPTTVVAALSATASATARVPAANGVELERAHRAVPEDGAAAGDPPRRRRRRLRPDVEAHPAVGDLDPVELRRSASAVNPSASTRSTGSRSSQLARLGVGQRPRAALDAVLSHREAPTSWPWARKKREAHRAADQDRVGQLEEALDHAELVGHLGAAEDGDQRPRRVREDSVELGRPRARAAGRRRRGTWWVTPSVEAWARWAAPKASLT